MVRPVLLVVLLFSLTSGCAVGRFGTLVGNVRPVEGGWLMDVYALGLVARPEADEAGATLGLTRTSYLFSVSEVTTPAGGWYAFRMPRVAMGRALLRRAETFGVDLRLSGPEPGVTLGAQRVVVSRPMPLEVGEFRSIVYRLDDTEGTCVSTDWGHPC